jgi:hypothetical protein
LQVGRLFNEQSGFAGEEKSVAGIGNLNASKMRRGRSLQSGNKQANFVMRGARGKFRHCYEEALRADHSLRGKVYLQFNVNEEGLPYDIEIKSDSELQSAGLSSCLKKVVSRLRFPNRTGKTMAIKHPLVFSPSQSNG